MRRILGVLLIFVIGITFGWLTFRWREQPRYASLPEAQQRALEVLSQPVVAMDAGDNRIVKAVKKLDPSVVNIDTVGAVKGTDDAGVEAREVRGKGSGVILTSDGYIVTNEHVIEGADRVRVTLSDGRWFYAHLVGMDKATDLAVVRVDVANLTAADFGDSDRLQVGEWAIALGNPLGLGSSTAVGVISALNRKNLRVDENRTLDGAIQTDAAINRGHSGGALANIFGQIIGINTAILSSTPQGGSIGLGFAIPSNTVRRIVREIILAGHASSLNPKTPFLGVDYDYVPDALAKQLRLEARHGVIVKRAIDKSPAQLSGILPADIILSVDDKVIGDRKDLLEAIRQHKPGDAVTLQILRPSLGKMKSFVVRLARWAVISDTSQ